MVPNDNKQVMGGQTIDYRNRYSGRLASITLVVDMISHCAGRRLDIGRPIGRLLSLQ